MILTYYNLESIPCIEYMPVHALTLPDLPAFHHLQHSPHDHVTLCIVF